MTSRRLVVLGTLASNPYAGMAWMHMQIVVGLARLGHDVTYVETTSNWPYDPTQQCKTTDPSYAVTYLASVAESFGVGDRWAYRATFADGHWTGPRAFLGDTLLKEADAVFNVAGSTRLAEDGLHAENLVYFGTDPVYHEVTYAAGHVETTAIVDEHQMVVTYGENIGTPASPIPPLPNLRARTRQPVLLDMWDPEAPYRNMYTTVANWKQDGREIVFDGEAYAWSKDIEFLRFIDVPRLSGAHVELATNLQPPESMKYGRGEPVKTRGVADDARSRLLDGGWNLAAAQDFTLNPWPYRDYINESKAEFSVARDLNVRLRSGWFSERSACYLAAGRPVIAQDTGFDEVLPTGEGLFSFSTVDEALTAIAAVEGDYERHRRAAREIAEEYFDASRVLTRLLDEVGL